MSLMFKSTTSDLREVIFRALIDDTDATGTKGGDGYANYGIDRTDGAIVVVRPDGYVGVVTKLDGIAMIDAYFSSFMAVNF